VLLISYKRPHETEGVLNKIKEYYPHDLYVFIDGGNDDNIKIDEVKQLIYKEEWV